MGPARLTVIGAVLVGMIGFFIFLTTKVSSPQMELLYSNLSQGDSSRIVNVLQSQSAEFEARNNGTEIFVKSGTALGLRMAMADEGLPSGGSVGYELFDQQSSMGTTNFQQNVNLVRALEGELSRTIGSLEQVRSARVHLVMPKRELFSRKQQTPTASIILKMRGATRLDRGQVQAIQHLVAAAVPGLNPNSISIIDNKGELLARSADADPNSPGVVANRNDERRRTLENQLVQTIEKLLEKSVGFGRVRAEVTVEMDFDRVSTNEEVFDPEGQVVRSTQSIERSMSQNDMEPNPVSVGGNLPDPTGAGSDAATRQANDASTEESVNYEISKKVINHVREGGTIRRLSVAVLVDGAYELNEDDDRIYRDRTPEEVEQLTSLVKSAVGIDEGRGDTIQVVNMKFADTAPPEEVPLNLFFGLEKNDLLRIAETLVLAIVAILVILLVVRPLISRAFEAGTAVAGAIAEGGRMLADQTQAAAGALSGPPVPGEGMQEEEVYEELIDIDRVEGRVKASSVKKVGEIVEKHPEEALSIVRSWMYQEG